MIYREAAEIPQQTGLIDAQRLADSVQQLESVHAQRKEKEQQQARVAKHEREQRARAKPPRIRIAKDVGGVLLDIRHQSAWWRPLTITWGVFTATALALTIWGVLRWSDLKVLAIVLGVLTVPAPAAALYYALRRGRPIRLYVANNGFFGVYRSRPDRPFAMGRAEHLVLDLRRDGDMKKMNFEYGGGAILELPCDRLSMKDVELLKRFAEAAGVKLD